MCPHIKSELPGLLEGTRGKGYSNGVTKLVDGRRKEGGREGGRQ